MKKYEMLEKAMRDYPAGTVARFKSAPHVDHVSTGAFRWIFGTGNGDCIISANDISCFYASDTDEWAEPVKESILNGKGAIEVNNEREFKLLMNHFDEIGYMPKSESDSLSILGFPEYWQYKENPYRPYKEELMAKGYSFVAFPAFAKEVGIKVPVFVGESQDGVGVYIGDQYFKVVELDEKWTLMSGVYFANANDLGRMSKEQFKAFSTKEAAEKWIEERNKPKYKEVELFTGMLAHVYGGEILIKDADRTVTKFRPSDLEDMLNAYKSL